MNHYQLAAAPPPPQPLANVLPADIASALREASQIREPFERRKAIDRITDQARKRHPSMFQKETVA